MALFSNIADEDFGLKGPTHLAKAVNWNKSDHRRSVAASLVNGVNILERGRQKKRRGERVILDTAWWESFDFKLFDNLVDVDASVFGAIYEFQPQAYDYDKDSGRRHAPRYVVAFQGTLLKLESTIEDLRLGINKVVLSNLSNSPRYQRAIKAVQKTVRDAGGPSYIWLAGHSLGSAIAMLTGKTMAKNNHPIETYLFNPPFPSVPLKQIQIPVVQRGILKTTSAGLSAAKNQKPQDDLFAGLYRWTPFLFVNSNDVICSEYIRYFEHRKSMKEIGARKIEKLFSELPVHLLPSAILITNQSYASEFIKAHEIYQWWRPDLNCQIESHIIKKECLDQTTDTEA